MKPKKCKVCGDKYTPKSNTLEPCPKYECRLVLWDKANKKLAAQARKKQREEKRIALEKNGLKKETNHRQLLQKEVQLIARLIDYKCLCLARNIVPTQKNGGHVYTNAGNTNMALNLHNIFLQAAQSNRSQKDDSLMQDGVARVFGEDYLSFIRGLKRTPIMKYTNDEYKEIRQRASVIIKQLKEWNRDLISPRSATSRIQLRNWANLELGIYPNEFLNF